MTIVKNCEECGKPGGTVPKHYWDGVTAMLHYDCAVAQVRRYMVRKSIERESPN